MFKVTIAAQFKNDVRYQRGCLQCVTIGNLRTNSGYVAAWVMAFARAATMGRSRTFGWSMTHASLQGCRVLLVEDDFLIADDFARRLTGAGAEVVGPAATLDAALEMYESAGDLDFVILDINLRGTAVFPLALRLQQDKIPFLFCSGYGDEPVRDAFADVAHFEKPISLQGFAAMINVIRQHSQGAPRYGRSAVPPQHLPM
ncbi:response regulator [Blastomonas aquatica]|uniref:response regulator n=1 Tax=Blastomonas aquatica TaxID=1510276 RepID=UPI001663A650|nr:response regulator [Blastomonas aquatica]